MSIPGTIMFRGLPVSVVCKDGIRRMSLRVDTKGMVSISVPCTTREETIRAALERRYDWILGKRQEMRERFDSTFMPETIEYGDLTVRVKRRATGRVDLRIQPPEAIIEVTAPFEMPLAQIQGLVEPHVPRLRESCDRMRKALPAPFAYESGEMHSLWGEKHELVIREASRPGVRLEAGRIVMDIEAGMDAADRRGLMRLFYSKCVTIALWDVVARYEKLMQVRVAGISCRFMKTRWGSCTSRNRTIRINCMLARYSKAMLEYVVVHEMCHFWEKGHSQAFYELVGRYYPNWKEVSDFLDRVSSEILV